MTKGAEKDAMAPTTLESTPRAAASPAPLSLDALARERGAALRARYEGGGVPDDLAALDGDLVGRMLEVRLAARSPLRGLVRRLAARPGFVWEGKSFHAAAPGAGEGINRVQLAGLGRQRLFPFGTLLGASLLDGRPAVILDYDRPENPAWIRRIHDEVREVAPGLWLGPAMVKGASGATLALWFALASPSRAV